MLTKIKNISNFYGSNPEFVLAGGGNTSCKDKEFLYIKASGESLGVIKEDGFVKMSCPKLSEMLTKEYPIDNDEREAAVLADLMDARVDTQTKKRPSVETLLHYLLPQTFVVHTHPAFVNGVMCVNGNKEIIKDIFGQETIWIKSMMPGYMLSKTVETEISNYKNQNGTNPQMLFLENHGVFVAADTIDGIKEIYNNIVEKLTSRIKTMPNLSEVDYDVKAVEAAKGILTANGYDFVEFLTNTQIMDFVADVTAFAPVSSVYTPDHMVYCGADTLFAEGVQDLENTLKNTADRPKIIAVKNLGMFACGNSLKVAQTAALLFADTVKIAVYTRSFGEYKFLSDDMIDFIGNWEVEKYRSSVSLK